MAIHAITILATSRWAIAIYAITILATSRCPTHAFRLCVDIRICSCRDMCAGMCTDMCMDVHRDMTIEYCMSTYA